MNGIVVILMVVVNSMTLHLSLLHCRTVYGFLQVAHTYSTKRRITTTTATTTTSNNIAFLLTKQGSSECNKRLSTTSSSTTTSLQSVSNNNNNKNLWSIEECIEKRDNIKFVDGSWYHKGNRNGRQELSLFKCTCFGFSIFCI